MKSVRHQLETKKYSLPDERLTAPIDLNGHCEKASNKDLNLPTYQPKKLVLKQI